jgi:hypothetical protein
MVTVEFQQYIIQFLIGKQETVKKEKGTQKQLKIVHGKGVI